MFWLLVGLLIAIIVLLVLSLSTSISALQRSTRAMQMLMKHSYPIASAHNQIGPVWVIINPVKIKKYPNFRAEMETMALAAGYPTPIFAETNPIDAGYEAARTAVAAGATLVISVGGDGTLRTVANALADTNIPLGIIPLGTGNLLARNMNLPVDNLPRAIDIALTGKTTALDLGRVKTDDKEEPFLVMGGLGFDGDMMRDVSDSLKQAMGWGAYVVSAFSSLNRPRIDVQVTYAKGERPHTERVRTLLFVSCGDLVGGLSLIPDANPHDGWLDVLFLDVRGGLFGWIEYLSRLVLQTIGGNMSLPEWISRTKVVRSRSLRVKVLSGAQEVQVDGDAIGAYDNLTVELLPQSLLLRVP